MSLNESDTAGLHSRAETVHVLEHRRNWALAVLRLCESEDLCLAKFCWPLEGVLRGEAGGAGPMRKPVCPSGSLGACAASMGAACNI